MHLLLRTVWGLIWKSTVEKSQTDATNVTMHHLRQAILGHIWKHKVEKSQTSATSVIMCLLDNTILKTHTKVEDNGHRRQSEGKWLRSPNKCQSPPQGNSCLRQISNFSKTSKSEQFVWLLKWDEEYPGIQVFWKFSFGDWPTKCFETQPAVVTGGIKACRPCCLFGLHCPGMNLR